MASIAYFLAPDLFTFMGQPPQTTSKGDIRGGRNFAPPSGHKCNMRRQGQKG